MAQRGESNKSAETPEAPTTPEEWNGEDGKSNTSAEDLEGPKSPKTSQGTARRGEV